MYQYAEITKYKTENGSTQLLEALKRHRGKVLISGYESELYNEMLKGWNKATKNTTAECSVNRTEVIWMNY